MTDIPIRYAGQDSTGAASASAKKNIDSVVKAASSGSGGVKGFNKALSDMSPAGRTANAALQQMQGGLSGLGSAAGIAQAALGGLVAGAVIGGVVQLGRALANLGVQAMGAQELEGAFQGVARTAGLVADDVLTSMQRASEGMVSNAELIAISNRAIMMKGADSIEEMTALMEIAKVRSDAVGVSVGEAFSALAEGIGRVSERQLYGLGIQLDMDAAMSTYAKSLGKTADKLSEAEKRQALYNAVVADSEGLVASAGEAGLSNADKMDQFAASWANLKQSVGELVAPAVIGGVQALTTAVQGLNNALAGTEIEKVTENLAGLKEDMAAAVASAGNEVTQQQIQIAEQIIAATQEKLSILRADLRTANAEAAEAARQLVDAQISGYDLKGYEDEVNRTRTVVEGLKTEIGDAEGTVRAYEYAIKSARQEMARIDPQLMEGGYGWRAQKEAAEAAAAAAELSAQRIAATQVDVAAAQERLSAIQADLARQAAAETIGWRDALIEITGAANAAGLSNAQLNGITGDLNMQFATLIEYGYTSADALDMVTQRALDQIAVMPTLQTAILGIGPAFVEAATVALEALGRISVGISGIMAQLGVMWGGITNIGPTGAPDARAGKRRGKGTGMANPVAPPITAPRTPILIGAPSTGNDIPYHPGENGSIYDRLGNRMGAAAASAAKLSGSAGKAADKLGELSGKLQGMLDKVPGLTSPSDVTEDQMKLAKLGIPQNFADDYLRRLTDEVMNGVDWQGVDIKDAAQRAGIDPNLPAEAILEMFKQSWANQSLFANPANLDLINMDAVKAALQQQAAGQQGNANLMALFGIGSDTDVSAIASLGLEVQSGLAQWLTENGMGDAGARIASALGAGMAESGIPADSGLNAWLGTDEASAALTQFSKDLGDRIPPAKVRTVLAPPEAPPGGAGAGSTTAPGAGAPAGTGGSVRVESVAQALFNGALTKSRGGAVVMNTVINTPMDEAKLKRMVTDIMRRGTART